MINDQQIADEILRLVDIKVLVETYETVAATSMRRIRDSVLTNRAFHEGLDRLYQDVKLAHEKEIAKLLEERRAAQKRLNQVAKSKSVYIFLSANTGLYGDIINKVFQLFHDEWKKKGCDAIIIGRVGKSMMEASGAGTQFQYFDFPDNKIEADRLKKIAEALGNYEEIVAFYGSFRSLLSQEPTFSSVSGDTGATVQQGKRPGEEARYLFEPSLDVVTKFFETEIFASLLEQVFHESRLAKLSSRMVLLDRANSQIDNELKKVKFQSQKLKHRAYNRKQLDVLNGVSLWSR